MRESRHISILQQLLGNVESYSANDAARWIGISGKHINESTRNQQYKFHRIVQITELTAEGGGSDISVPAAATPGISPLHPSPPPSPSLPTALEGAARKGVEADEMPRLVVLLFK